MKAKDIKPGEVYGYRTSRYNDARPIMLLAPADKDHIYRASHGAGPTFSAAKNATRAGGHYGYAAVAVVQQRFGKKAADPAVLDSVTLDEFLAARSHLDTARGIEYLVVTSTTYIIGRWEDVQTEADAKRAQEREREAEREAHRERIGAQKTALAVLGVSSVPVVVGSGNSVHTISADDMDKLLAALASKED